MAKVLSSQLNFRAQINIQTHQWAIFNLFVLCCTCILSYFSVIATTLHFQSSHASYLCSQSSNLYWFQLSMIMAILPPIPLYLTNTFNLTTIQLPRIMSILNKHLITAQYDNTEHSILYILSRFNVRFLYDPVEDKWLCAMGAFDQHTINCMRFKEI